MAAKLPQPALAFPGTISPASVLCSPPDFSPCVLPLAWCPAELRFEEFWHHWVHTELLERPCMRALEWQHPPSATAM